MKYRFLFLTLLFCVNSFAAIHTNSLDPEHKVTIENITPSGVVQISYDNQKFKLNGNTIYLDCELSDKTASLSPFIFNNVREAFQEINVGPESTTVKTILIAPGVYWINDPNAQSDSIDSDSSPYAMIIDCPKVSLIGLTHDPKNVVIATNFMQRQGMDETFTLFYFISEEIEAQNITFGNFSNVDLIFPLKKEYSHPKVNDETIRVKLIQTTAEKFLVNNCLFTDSATTQEDIVGK